MSAQARQDAIEAAWTAWQEARPDGSPITPLALPDIQSVSEAMFDAGRASSDTERLRAAEKLGVVASEMASSQLTAQRQSGVVDELLLLAIQLREAA